MDIYLVVVIDAAVEIETAENKSSKPKQLLAYAADCKLDCYYSS